MNTHPHTFSRPHPGTPPAQHTRWLNWWYALTVPSTLGAGTSLAQRETQRAATLSSTMLLMLLVLDILAIPYALFGPNQVLLYILIALFIITLGAAGLNKYGRIMLVSVLVVISYTVAIMLDIVTTPGGLTPQLIPTFTVLIIPEILAAALISARYVFAFALVNIVFSLLAVLFMPYGTAPNAFMPMMYVNAVILPAILQAIIAGVAFLWASSMESAMRERDRAQEVVRLQRDISNQSYSMAQQKEQLEYSIDLIVQTQSQVANGNLDARVPLTPDNVLWSVAGTLNNLIARLQRSQAMEQELEQTKVSASRLVSIIRQRKQHLPAKNYTCTGTVVDTVAMEVFSPVPGQHPMRTEPLPRIDFR